MTAALVVGAGPAGLMAAEALAEGGHKVIVADAAPSPARKFLLAGRGGLNLTHSEPLGLSSAATARRARGLSQRFDAFPPDGAARLERGARRADLCRLERAGFSPKLQGDAAVARMAAGGWRRSASSCGRAGG